MNESHSRHSTDKVQPWKPSGKEESSEEETTRPVLPRDTWHCTNSGSRSHKPWDCWRPPDERGQVQSSLRRHWRIDVRDCKRSGPLHSIRRWQVSTSPVLGWTEWQELWDPCFMIMVDPGSSATRISFEQFKKIGQQARILIEELLLTPRL